jgi:hypothetical protein
MLTQKVYQNSIIEDAIIKLEDVQMMEDVDFSELINKLEALKIK